MDNRDALKSMLNNLINDKPEEASLDLHGYLTAKMKDVSGLTPQVDNTEIDADEDVAETDPE
jgi:hypothetical protein